MSSDTSKHDPIHQLADEYIASRRMGQKPPIEDFCDRIPDRADEIRKFLRTVELMEDFPSQAEDASPEQRYADPQLKSIGGYRVIREIGRGGMGVVYEAEHVGLARKVALKVLPQSTSQSDTAKQRFEREARTAAGMHHTNIVPVYEVGHAEGFFFYAMQLIHGRSLDRVIQQLKSSTGSAKETIFDMAPRTSDDESVVIDDLPSSSRVLSSLSGASVSANRRFEYKVAAVMLQAAEALSYSHDRQVIHRDIKPSNLILDDSGVVWLTDFGLAKTDDDGLTQTGEFLGTLRYMAPERFKGRCEASSDIYALGLTMYELLTQRLAFEASDRLSLIEAISNSEPARPRAVNPRIPRDLETIVLTAVDKEPSHRYSSAGKMADDLRAFLRDEPIQARRSSMLERTVRWARRNKRLATALCGIVALLALFGVRESVLRHRAESSQQVAESSQRIAEQRGDELLDLSQELRRTLYFSEMNVAGEAASDNFGAPTVNAQLSKWNPEPGEPDLRGWEWYFLYSLANRERYVSPEQSGWVWSSDFNPAGTEYVNCVNGWGIQVRSMQSGKVVREKFLGAARFVRWSPDGEQIVVSGFNGTVSVCDAKSLEVIRKIGIEEDGREVWCVKWSPDGKRLATANRGKSGDKKHIVRIWDATSGELMTNLEGHTTPASDVSWSPDGNLLASAASGDNVRIWNASTGLEILAIDRIAETLCWSPDGEQLFLAHDSIEVVDSMTGEAVASFASGDVPTVTRIRLRPGNTQLACGHSDGTLTLWDRGSGQKLRTLYGHADALRDIAWSADGNSIVTCGMDNTVRVWDLSSNDQTQILPTVSNDVEWSHDGNRLAASGIWTSRVSIWNTGSGAGQLVDSEAHQVDDVKFSPDDSKLAWVGRDFLKVYDLETQETSILDNTHWAWKVDWNQDGSRLVTACRLAPDLMIWDADTGELVVNLEQEHPTSVHWSNGGPRFATAGANGLVKVRDGDGNLIWEATRGRRIEDIRWSPDDSQLASVENGAIVIWDAATGEVGSVLDAVREHFTTVDWSPDGNRIVSGSNNSARIWDPKSGHVAMRLPVSSASCVRWSRDGRRIACAGSDAGVYIADASRAFNRQP